MLIINSEIIAGLAILLMGVIFIHDWNVKFYLGNIFLVYFLIMALGVASIGLGIWTAKYERKTTSS